MARDPSPGELGGGRPGTLTAAEGRGRATGGLSPLLKMSNSLQGLDFCPDGFSATGRSGREGQGGPQHPEQQETEHLTEAERPHP